MFCFLFARQSTVHLSLWLLLDFLAIRTMRSQEKGTAKVIQILQPMPSVSLIEADLLTTIKMQWISL